MSPHRLKARGGAGSKISLPPPSISPHLTCKILQERRALRKLFGPPCLDGHPLKPSLPPARRVPINTKETTRHKKVSSVARLATAPSQKQASRNSFKKPFCVGHGVSTSIIPCRGNGSASKAVYGATRVERNANVNVCSKRAGKLDAPQARLSKAHAICTLQIKTGEKHLTQGAQQQADYEKENNPAQQNCISSSAFQTCERSLLSNNSGMQCAYDVTVNEDDCNIEWKGKAPIRCGQTLPSIFMENDDRDQILPLSSFYKSVIDESFTPHDQSTRRSSNSDMLDICADVNACRFVAHSNANLQEIDRSRDTWKLSGSSDDQAKIDPSCGDVNSGKNESQTYTSVQEFSEDNWRVEKPRIFSNDASDVFNGICTPQSKASSPELYATDSNRNVGQKLQSVDEAVFDNPFTSDQYAQLQVCDDAHSGRIGFNNPRSSDHEVVLSPEYHGNAGILDNSYPDDDAYKFASEVNAILLESDDNRSRGKSIFKQRSQPSQEAVFKSPWSDVDACEFALHESFADYQEIDDSDSSGKACVTECDHHLTPKMLSFQAPSRDINNAVKIGKHTHSLQEKLALFEGNVNRMAAILRKTSDQLDAKIHGRAVVLSCIQSKLSSIQGLVTRMEAFNCEDLRD